MLAERSSGLLMKTEPDIHSHADRPPGAIGVRLDGYGGSSKCDGGHALALRRTDHLLSIHIRA
jgi:hypothetical protein